MSMNIVDMELGLKTLAAGGFSPEDYGTEFLNFFSGGSKTKLLRIKSSPSAQSDVPGGYIWKLKLHYAPALPGKADEVLTLIKSSKKTIQNKPRLLFVNDGNTVLVFDVKYQELTSTTVESVCEQAHLFYPLIDVEIPRQTAESPIDIKATAKLAKLYDALVEKNPDWIEGEKRHDFNHFMTQIIFTLFAEDTGILPNELFTKSVKTRSGGQGEFATNVIRDIFNILDKPNRENVEPWLKEFPYVNGGLFKGEAIVPEFTAKAYRYLLEAASLDWKEINPDILGSSIQAIVDPKMRGDLGMHYTNVENILKVLDSLFLDNLRDHLFASRSNVSKLKEFLSRLMKIRLADFAAGSGNFLIIGYRELRKLELQALDALRDLEGGKRTLSFGFGTHISLSNFYGIEIADFAAETAKLGLWIAEYQMNKRFSAAFGADIPALPLREAGNIICGNALRMDWNIIFPVSQGTEDYICGNPPFLGKSKQNEEQKKDLDFVFQGIDCKYRSLDYVAAWFVKAKELMTSRKCDVAFVSTNSIVQGLSVINLWPYLLKDNIKISFAHRSFKWSNNASNNAGVTCVIVGLTSNQKIEPKIFDKDGMRKVSNINAYLLDAKTVFIKERSKPISSDLPSMVFGNMPNDDGNLLLTHEEYVEVTQNSPEIKRYIRKFLGSEEFIHNTPRYCIWLNESDLHDALGNSFIKDRINKTEKYRLESNREATRKCALKPHRFGEVRQFGEDNTIVIPRVSSELRPYLPCGILTNGEIISDRNFGIFSDDLWVIAIIASRLHIVWISTVCVRLEERFSYSNTIGWNTFPIPRLSHNQKEELGKSARKILLTRENHLGLSIADLYDEERMPRDLLKVHEENDALLESFYRNEAFKNDEERLAHLFELYTEMAN